VEKIEQAEMNPSPRIDRASASLYCAKYSHCRGSCKGSESISIASKIIDSHLSYSPHLINRSKNQNLSSRDASRYPAKSSLSVEVQQTILSYIYFIASSTSLHKDTIRDLISTSLQNQIPSPRPVPSCTNCT